MTAAAPSLTSGDERNRHYLLIRRHLAAGDLAAAADSRRGLPRSSRRSRFGQARVVPGIPGWRGPAESGTSGWSRG